MGAIATFFAMLAGVLLISGEAEKAGFALIIFAIAAHALERAEPPPTTGELRNMLRELAAIRERQARDRPPAHKEDES